MDEHSVGRIYDFVFRGLLTEESLDKSGRERRTASEGLDEDIAARLALDALDESFVLAARRMAVVYTAIAAFENSVRKLISTVLLEQLGENWWEAGVSEKIRKKSETRRSEEQKVRWHAQRGEAPIAFVDLADLGNIIRNNWIHFEAFMPSIEWAASVFDVLERSRNVIMHSGDLGLEDVERVGINIRDWTKQVGA